MGDGGGVDLDAWGIDRGYLDVVGTWHDAPQATIDAVVRSMGAASGPDPTAVHGAGPLVLLDGETTDLGGPWAVEREDGTQLEGDGALPPQPLGYHRVHHGGAWRRLIVAPFACPAPDDRHQWGWAAQLYAMRSRRSWGIGDFGDLSRFADLVRGFGATLVLVNPLHAPLPGIPQEASPYYPSSREFRNPLYIAVEDVPGATECGAELEEMAAQGRALNADRRIDRDEVWRRKLGALQRIWERTTPPVAFEEWCAGYSTPLRDYATYCAIAEQHPGNWGDWPDELQHPRSAAVAVFAEAHADRVRFHQWLQWLADAQLAQAARRVDVVQDLAIGVDPFGADAWQLQEAMALDARVGAPPDDFNRKGQDWGLPPFDPWRLRALDYEPFARVVRAGLRHGGGLRVDHVMGLFRLFWIPVGAGAAEGTYVRYPFRDLLAIVALESMRAGALVVGEDLGTVEPWVRDELFHRNVMSYRLLWFEQQEPATFPKRSFAAVTTHDLPTVAGLWTGSDLRRQEEMGTSPNVEATQAIRDRLRWWGGLEDGATASTAVAAAHRLLAAAPSAMRAVTLEDTLGVEERPNYPGTTSEHPNWSIALPEELDDFADDPRFAEVAKIFGGISGHPGDHEAT